MRERFRQSIRINLEEELFKFKNLDYRIDDLP